MVDLRDYQTEAIAKMRRAMTEGHQHILLVAPTGSGKTTIASEVIRGAVGKGNPVLFLAHREELIFQASARLDTFGIDHGIIKSGADKVKASAPVQVASIQTLVRREAPPAKVVIIDEAHRTAGASYQKILAQYPNATVVGLTATPIRLDGKGLGDTYTAMVEAALIEDLVAKGVLVKPRVFAPTRPDLSGVATAAGDFRTGQLDEVMNRPRLTGDIVGHWQRLADGRPTVAFASSVDHSLALRDAFRAAGVSAEHLDGNTPSAERVAILQGLADGSIALVSNCGILTEGWDCPIVSCVVLARPTQSLGLYLQMVGRVLRPADGKADAIVLDHAGCTFEHGLATDSRSWTLDTGKKQKPPAPSLKSCPACYSVVPSATMICPDCTHEWTPAERAAQLQVDMSAELVELSKLPPPWADWPRNIEHLKPKKRTATMAEKQAVYNHFAAIAKARGFKDGWVSHSYRRLLGVWPQRIKRAA